jgi:hypothetical protein
LVEQRRWLTADQFNETFVLCAFLPGGNIVNICVIFGTRTRGPVGALAALGGLLGPPMVLVMIVGAVYAHYVAAAATPVSMRRCSTNIRHAQAKTPPKPDSDIKGHEQLADAGRRQEGLTGLDVHLRSH